jgi:hypothetical protein
MELRRLDVLPDRVFETPGRNRRELGHSRHRRLFGRAAERQLHADQAVAYYGSHADNYSVLGYDGGVTLARNFAMANGCT